MGMTFFDNVKTLCDERAVSIAQFETDVGITGRNSYKWRDHTPNVAVAIKIAKYFGVPVERLMEGVPDRKESGDDKD